MLRVYFQIFKKLYIYIYIYIYIYKIYIIFLIFVKWCICIYIYISAVKVNNALMQINFNGTNFFNARLTQRLFSV